MTQKTPTGSATPNERPRDLRNRRRPRTPWCRPLRATYLGVLAIATLAPFHLDLDPQHVWHALAGLLRPTGTARDLIDAVQNIALFGGWGVIWLATADGHATPRRALGGAVLTGFLASATIELIQAAIPSRIPSVLDLLTNTAGAGVGALLVVWLIRRVRQAAGRRSYVGAPLGLAAGGYGVAVMLDALFAPFRLTPIPGLFGGPLVRADVVWQLASWRSLVVFPLADLFLYWPAGALAVLALAERGWGLGRAAWWTAGMGALIAAMVELLHAPLGIPIQGGAMLWHAAAVAAGAWLASRAAPAVTQALRGAARSRALLVLYGVLVALWAWRPFVFSAAHLHLDLGRLIPLAGSAGRMDLFSVADVVVTFALYVPLGGVLAVWPIRRRGALDGFLPAAFLAGVLELTQIFVVDRYADMTDILVALAGAGIGWLVVRRAGFRPYGDLLPGAAYSTPRPER